MSALSPILRLAQDNTLIFWCPGCNRSHGIKFGSGQWTWNGDPIKPTFSPSVLVTSGHYSDGNKTECWCNFEARFGEKSSFKCYRCHSFVVDGMIQFLGDCTHELVGQTVPLFPKWYNEEEGYHDNVR